MRKGGANWALYEVRDRQRVREDVFVLRCQIYIQQMSTDNGIVNNNNNNKCLFDKDAENPITS